MNAKQQKLDFTEHVNVILDLSATYQAEHYESFCSKYSHLTFLSEDGLKSLHQLIKILNIRFHPNNQHQFETRLSYPQTQTLLEKLKQSADVIREYGDVFSDMDIVFDYNKNANGHHKNDGVKSLFSSMVGRNKSDKNEAKDQPYIDIRNRDLRQLFIDWDMMHKGLNHIHDEKAYREIYNEMVDSLFHFFGKANKHSDIKLASQRMVEILQGDVQFQHENGNQVNVLKQFKDKFDLFTVSNMVYRYDEKTSLNMVIFGENFNTQMGDTRYRLSVKLSELRNEVLEQILLGFADKDNDLIKNIKRHGFKLTAFLNAQNDDVLKVKPIEHDLFIETLSKLNDTQKQVLLPFLVDNHAIDCQKVSAKKSFIKEHVMGDLAEKLLSKERQQHDLNDRNELFVYRMVYKIMGNHVDDLHKNDVDVIQQYAKQMVLSESLDLKDERAFLKQVERVITSGKHSHSHTLNDFQNDIQDIRDENFTISLAKLCLEKPKYIKTLSLFRDYNVASPDPQGAYDELSKLGFVGIEYVTFFKDIQADYRLRSMGLLHHNNANHKPNELLYDVYNIIWERELINKNMVEKVAYAIKTEGMLPLLSVAIQDTENTKALGESILSVMIDTRQDKIANGNKKQLFQFLNRYSANFKQAGVSFDSVHNIQDRDSLLFQYIDTNNNNGLSEQLKLMSDYHLFKDVHSALNKDDGLSNMMLKGMNFVLKSKPILAVFQAYEEQDLDNLRVALSKVKPNQEIGLRGLPLVSYMGIKGMLKPELLKFNQDVIDVLQEQRYKVALNQMSPNAGLAYDDCVSAYQRLELQQVLQNENVLKKVGRRRSAFWGVRFSQSPRKVEQSVSNDVVAEKQERRHTSSLKPKG